MISKRPPTLLKLARRAFLDHLTHYSAFSEALVRFENKTLRIEGMSHYFEMSMQADRKWLEAESKVIEADICNMIPDEYDHNIDIGIEQNRLTALRYLREQCGVKI